MTDIKPSLHIYDAQYLYLTLLFWLPDLWPLCGDLYLEFARYSKNCLNKTSHQCQNGIFAAFCQYVRPVRMSVTLVDLWSTFQGQIGHCDLGLCLLVQYCLNKTPQCQNGIFGEFYQYLGWVLTFDLLFKVSTTCLSVHPISPSLYTWLTSNHLCIFTMPSTCISHYYFGSPTFDLGMVTLTLTLLVTAKLPEPNITWIPKWYICCVLPISRMSLKGSELGGPLTHFSRSDRSLQDLLPQYHLNQISHPC